MPPYLADSASGSQSWLPAASRPTLRQAQGRLFANEAKVGHPRLWWFWQRWASPQFPQERFEELKQDSSRDLRAERNGPAFGGAMKRGATLCQFLVFGDHRDAVKLRGEIISVFSPQNGSSTETGVWTRRESNPHLHFDREPCYPLHHGP